MGISYANHVPLLHLRCFLGTKPLYHGTSPLAGAALFPLASQLRVRRSRDTWLRQGNRRHLTEGSLPARHGTSTLAAGINSSTGGFSSAGPGSLIHTVARCLNPFQLVTTRGDFQ
jgi:hypothetical protein